ncbi:MAG: hypothetical protein ACK5BN_17040 [Planctomycetota bacterium]
MVASDRSLRDERLRPARDLLAPWLDWDRVAAARLTPKERFTVALLVEAVDCLLVTRGRPAPWPGTARP